MGTGRRGTDAMPDIGSLDAAEEVPGPNLPAELLAARVRPGSCSAVDDDARAGTMAAAPVRADVAPPPSRVAAPPLSPTRCLAPACRGSATSSGSGLGSGGLPCCAHASPPPSPAKHTHAQTHTYVHVRHFNQPVPAGAGSVLSPPRCHSPLHSPLHSPAHSQPHSQSESQSESLVHSRAHSPAGHCPKSARCASGGSVCLSPVALAVVPQGITANRRASFEHRTGIQASAHSFCAAPTASDAAMKRRSQAFLFAE